MEKQNLFGITKNGGIEIPNEVIYILGSELKSTCIKDVWLLITSTSDNRLEGKPMQYEGTTYILPKNQMSALKMSTGDTIRLVFSEVLQVMFLQKQRIESEHGESKNVMCLEMSGTSRY